MFEENILRSFVRRVNPAITIDKIHLEEHGNAPYWSNYNQFLNKKYDTFIEIQYNVLPFVVRIACE